MTEKKNTRFSSVLNRAAIVPEPPPEFMSEPEDILPTTKSKMGRPPGKKSNPEYTQVTVYLRKEVHQAARKLLIDEQRQFSDLVGDLVSQWISDTRKPGSSQV